MASVIWTVLESGERTARPLKEPSRGRQTADPLKGKQSGLQKDGLWKETG